MTQSAATPHGHASATFRSVEPPCRTVKYDSDSLGRETSRLQALEPSRDVRVMNKPV